MYILVLGSVDAAYIKACVWIPSYMSNVPVRKGEERACETSYVQEGGRIHRQYMMFPIFK